MAYIYKHTRKDNGEVFYVGLSLKNDPKHGRAYSRGDRRNTHWKNIVNNTEYEVHIIEDNLTPEEAIAKEKEYIALYGRKDLGLGTLCNFTDGGEGGLLGYRHTEEWKKRNSERQLGELNHNYGKSPSQEVRDKISRSSKGRVFSDETREKLSKGKIGNKNPNFGLFGKDNPNFGRKASQELKDLLSKMQKGKPSLNRIKVIDTITKKVYACGAEAIVDLKLNIKATHLNGMLSGRRANWTSLVRLDDYNNINDFNKLKIGQNNSPKERVIFNKVTGIFYNSVKDAYDSLNSNISRTHFGAMLRGKYPNKTPYIYA